MKYNEHQLRTADARPAKYVRRWPNGAGGDACAATIAEVTAMRAAFAGVLEPTGGTPSDPAAAFARFQARNKFI